MDSASNDRLMLAEAVRALAQVCDGAIAPDGQGFNGVDTRMGRRLARVDERTWTGRQTRALWRMLGKYRGQLERRGIDYAAIPVPPEAGPAAARTMEVEDERFVLRFPYDPVMVAAVKAIRGARFTKEPAPAWTVPAAVPAAEPLLGLVADHDFEPSDRAVETLEALALQVAEVRDASRAHDADLVVDGLGGTLRPFQRAGVAYALRSKRCIIADDMGLGKTVEALATIQAAGAYPALIVCPASLRLNWQREARHWLPGRTAYLVEPAAPGTFAADLMIINYDRLARHDKGCQFGKHKDAKDPAGPCRTCALMLRLKDAGYRAIVMDEFHYAKGYKANRTASVKWLAARVPYRLGLTGTPFLNRPQEGISPLIILGRLDDLGGFWHYASRYCQAYRTKWGTDMSGAAHLDELNEKMRAICYIRRLKGEVLKELPAKQRAVVPVDLTNRAEYEAAEADLIAWLGQNADRDAAFEATLKGLPAAEQKERRATYRDERAAAAESAEQLVRFGVLKRLAARGKMEAVKEWVATFLESDEKLVLFAHHIDIQKALLAEFPGAARLFGEDDAETRQANVDRFQQDPACRLIVCSLKAGGVGITLTAASNVAFVEQGWTPADHDQAEDRTHRIGQHDQVTAWYLLADRTIDMEIADLIERKRAVVDAATEGKPAAKQAGILGDLVDRMLAKRQKEVA